MKFRSFPQIHFLFCALLFSCNVFSDPVLDQQEGESLFPGSLITWTDSDIGSDYWAYVGTQPGARNLLDSGNISNQMSLTVADWPEEFFVRLWYRPTGLAWAFVDRRYTIPTCPAPVREQYDLVKKHVDNGIFVAKISEEFDGFLCTANFGTAGTDEYDYGFLIRINGESEPDLRPAIVSARGSSLWVTQSEALACVDYIGC